MSDFISTYQERQALRVKIKKLRTKIDWKEFIKLKERERLQKMIELNPEARS
jgi:hypothetical protein